MAATPCLPCGSGHSTGRMTPEQFGRPGSPHRMADPNDSDGLHIEPSAWTKSGLRFQVSQSPRFVAPAGSAVEGVSVLVVARHINGDHPEAILICTQLAVFGATSKLVRAGAEGCAAHRAPNGRGVFRHLHAAPTYGTIMT